MHVHTDIHAHERTHALHAHTRTTRAHYTPSHTRTRTRTRTHYRTHYRTYYRTHYRTHHCTHGRYASCIMQVCTCLMCHAGMHGQVYVRTISERHKICSVSPENGSVSPLSTCFVLCPCVGFGESACASVHPRGFGAVRHRSLAALVLPVATDRVACGHGPSEGPRQYVACPPIHW